MEAPELAALPVVRIAHRSETTRQQPAKLVAVRLSEQAVISEIDSAGRALFSSLLHGRITAPDPSSSRNCPLLSISLSTPVLAGQDPSHDHR